jgi:ketosteroid isomerase-like protein
MIANESDNIIKEVKTVSGELAKHSEEAELDSFLDYYDNSPAFLHFSSDGKMRNYEEFKKVCSEYYTSLQQQKLFTVTEKFNVLDKDLVITGWTGNILAQFKNGDAMTLNNYSITNVFKKIDGKWKIIHSHESSQPPEIKRSKG